MSIEKKSIEGYSLLTLCLYELGGNDVDREDVYLKMRSKDPKHFGLRTRPDILDIKKADSKADSAINKYKFVKRTSEWGYSITEAGIEHAKLISNTLGNKTLESRPAQIKKYEESIFKKVIQSQFYQNWKESKVKEYAWEDIDDCCDDLGVMSNMKDEKLIEFLSKLIVATEMDRYKELNLFFKQSIENIKEKI